MPAVRIEITDTKQTEALLKQLPIELREKALKKALRKAGAVVNKQAKANLRSFTRPGYPGDDPDKKPLERTFKVVIRSWKTKVIGFVGAEYPLGAHSHLVEGGHQIVLPPGRQPRTRRADEEPAKTFVEPRPYFEPAADSTRLKQQTAIIETLKREKLRSA